MWLRFKYLFVGESETQNTSKRSARTAPLLRNAKGTPTVLGSCCFSLVKHFFESELLSNTLCQFPFCRWMTLVLTFDLMTPISIPIVLTRRIFVSPFPPYPPPPPHTLPHPHRLLSHPQSAGEIVPAAAARPLKSPPAGALRSATKKVQAQKKTVRQQGIFFACARCPNVLLRTCAVHDYGAYVLGTD